MATSLVLHGVGAAFALLVFPRLLSRPAGHAEVAPTVLELSVEGSLPEAQGQTPPVARAPTHAVRRSPAPVHLASANAKPTGLPAPSAPSLALPVPISEAAPAALAVAETPPAPRRLAHFALSAGSIAGRSDANSDARSGSPRGESRGQDLGGASGDGDAGDAAGAVAESVVDVPARLTGSAPLVYPEAARRAEIELDLPLEIVVSRQGRVLSASVMAHPGYGLEQAALSAVRSYMFVPARHAGREVAVKMRWTMQFRLR